MDLQVVAAIAGAVVLVAAAVVLVKTTLSKKTQKIEADESQRVRRLVAEGRHSQAATLLVSRGRLKEAIDLLVSAGDFRAAGRVALRLQDYGRAAELFERAQDLEAAANAYLKVPDKRRAAECFSRAGNHEKSSEIYLQVGDLWAAAEEMLAIGRKRQAAAVYRQLGNDLLADKLMAEALREEGDFRGAAEAFVNAGDAMAAGECFERAGMAKEAAEAYQKAGRLDLAAQVLERSGAVSEAAALYEEAGDHQAAARLYQKVQDPGREIQALVSAGDYLAAGYLAYKHGQKERAEEILKLCAPGDKGFARCCLLLGRICEETGRRHDAIKHYALFVERAEPTAKTRSVFEYLAGLFERERMNDVAIRCLRKLEQAGLLQGRYGEMLRKLADKMASTFVTGEIPKVQSDVDPRVSIPPQLSDRYTIISRLGEGGTAVVVLAHDNLLRRNVVLKILANPSLPGPLAEEYFMREAQIVAAMSHPNIVTIYDIGNAAGKMYIVMEYIEGKSLDKIIDEQKGKGLPFRQVLHIAAQLAEALSYAHSRQVIHRDLKPANVMVLPDGLVKLMDFGMAKALQIHRDRSLYICGTPDYMSPEQEAGADLTQATDIYSFGLVILEALLGYLPSAATAAAAREKRLEALEKSGLPEGVKRVIRACLELDPQNRPKSARLVVQALARVDIAK